MRKKYKSHRILPARTVSAMGLREVTYISLGGKGQEHPPPPIYFEIDSGAPPPIMSVQSDLVYPCFLIHIPHNPNTLPGTPFYIIFYLQRFSNPHISQTEHILMGTELFGYTRSNRICLLYVSYICCSVWTCDTDRWPSTRPSQACDRYVHPGPDDRDHHLRQQSTGGRGLLQYEVHGTCTCYRSNNEQQQQEHCLVSCQSNFTSFVSISQILAVSNIGRDCVRVRETLITNGDTYP